MGALVKFLICHSLLLCNFRTQSSELFTHVTVNSAVHPLSVGKSVPRLFILGYHSGGIQATGPHQLNSCPYTNLH